MFKCSLNSLKSYIIIFSIIFISTACGSSSGGGSDKDKVSVSFNINGVFENSDGTAAKAMAVSDSLYVGGHKVKSLVFDYNSESSALPDSGSVDILNAVIQGQNRVQVELYPQVTYKFEIEAEGDNLVICRGSEKKSINLKKNEPIRLICALRTEIELNIDKKAEVLRLLSNKSDNNFQQTLDDLYAAIDNDMSVKEVVNALELSETTLNKGINNEDFNKLVADFKKLKDTDETAFNKLKDLVLSFSNTAELRESLRILDDKSFPFPDMIVRPSSLNFGDVKAGYFSNPMKLNVLNLGYTDLDVSGIITRLGYNVSFDGLDDSCASSVFSLKAGESCSFNVRLKSFVVGNSNSTLSILSNDSNNGVYEVPLTAKVIQIPPVTMNKTIFNFSSKVTGKESVPQSLILTNSSNSVINSITTANLNNFRIVNNCGVLPVGDTCNIDIFFKPLHGVQGEVSEEFELKTSTGGSVNVFLSGYAVPKGTQMKSLFIEDSRVASLGDENLAVCDNGKAHALLNTETKLIYAYYNGSTWFKSNAIITAEKDKPITNVAIAVDNECIPYIAYIADEKAYYASLKATGTNEPWTPRFLAEANSVNPIKIVRANNSIIIAFVDADMKGLQLFKSDETNAITLQPYSFNQQDILDFDVKSSGVDSLHFFVSLDQGGDISAKSSAYVNAKLQSSSIVWSDEHYLGTDEVMYPLLTVANNYLMAIYQDNSGYLKYYKNTGGVWTVTTSQVSTDVVNGGFSATADGNVIRLVYKDYSGTYSDIKQSLFDGVNWNIQAESVYENADKPFFMGGSALAMGGNSRPMVLFDIDSNIVSKSFDGADWTNSSQLIQQVGVNQYTSFDLSYATQLQAVMGVIGDRYTNQDMNYGGGLYVFSLKEQNTAPVFSFDSKKYYVTDVRTLVDANDKIHSCFVYDVAGTRYVAYFGTLSSPLTIGEAASGECSISLDDNNIASVLFVNDSDKLLSIWDSQTNLVEPILTDIDSDISAVVKYINSVRHVLYNSPNFNSLHLKGSGPAFSVDSTSSYQKTPHYLALGQDSGGQAIAAIAGDNTYGSSTSKLSIYDCDPATTSCEPLYTEKNKKVISGLSMAVSNDDNVHAAFYSGSEGLVYLEYPLSGESYERRVIADVKFEEDYGDGVKLLLNPVNGLAHLLYRDGDKLMYVTEDIRPVLSTSVQNVIFPTATLADRTKIAEIKIQNTGFKPLAVNSIAFKNGNIFVLEDGTCPINGFTFGIGAEPCTIRIRFAPVSSGSFADSLEIKTNVGSESISVIGTASGINF